MKENELKPCPFCGSKRLYVSERNYFGEKSATVTCVYCHISQTGSEYETKEEAIEAWNRRT